MGLRIAVCGAGIAGAAATALLARAGHEVILVERDQGVRTSGAPVDIRHGAQRVIAELGLSSEVAQHATNVAKAQFVNDAGVPIAGMRTSRRDLDEHEIARSDLSRLLVRAAQQVADVRFGATIQEVESLADGLEVTLDQSGSSRFDLVIGADGIHSSVRRRWFGPEREFSRPLGICVATVSVDGMDAGAGSVLMQSQPGATVALHPGTTTPVAAFMFRSDRSGLPRDRDQVSQVIRDRYRSFGWIIPELVESFCHADHRYFDIVTRIDVQDWSRGRITLLGDAAGCVSLFAEGSSSALIAAQTLTRAITDSGDILMALSRYQHLHRRAIGPHLRKARLGSHLLIPASRLGLSARNKLLRLADPRGQYRRWC